jgi:hypothetical protein
LNRVQLVDETVVLEETSSICFTDLANFETWYWDTRANIEEELAKHEGSQLEYISIDTDSYYEWGESYPLVKVSINYTRPKLESEFQAEIEKKQQEELRQGISQNLMEKGIPRSLAYSEEFILALRDGKVEINA